MKLGFLLAMLCLCPVSAQAEIYKAVDAMVTSRIPARRSGAARRSFLSRCRPWLRPRERALTPEDFPRVDGATQRGRDDTRRKILQDELSTEGRLLEESRKNLKEGEANRDVVKDKEKFKTLTEQVDLHQKNIDALKTELSKLK